MISVDAAAHKRELLEAFNYSNRLCSSADQQFLSVDGSRLFVVTNKLAVQHLPAQSQLGVVGQSPLRNSLRLS